MDEIIENFRLNLTRVRALGVLYKALVTLTTKVIDTSDILRAQIVLVVSSLDYYIHQVVLLGMSDAFDDKRPKTQSFLNFRVSMDSVIKGSDTVDSIWFQEEVRDNHSFLSFQKPDRIADAIRFFSDIKLWQEVSKILSMPEKDIKDNLTLIVDRRNKIAHEADMDPSYPGLRWPITENDVEQTIDFIEKLCDAIHSCVQL